MIARKIGRAPSTVSREVARSGGRGRYKAIRAENLASVRSLRPKRSKLAGNSRLRREVQLMLESYLSPRQISKKLEIEHPDDLEMRISPETIYQSLYVQARGRFRKDLTAYLRTRRKRRKPQGKTDTRGKIKDMVMISERPAEAEDRAVPGHWEGDLIVGKSGRSFIGTLVERHTRYVMLIYLGKDSTTETVCEAIAEKITQLPEHLRRSLTWDQGKEMANHASFSVKSGVPVYFCEPHSPWQRGSNENTNGLLRQFFPKGTDLSQHGPAELDRVAHLMNTRPRETLDWMTPAEKMNELLLR
jgi:IS30 family transposase